MKDLTETIAAVILGDRSSAQALLDREPAEVRRVVDAHGVLPLVARQFDVLGIESGPIGAALAEEARRRAVADLWRTHELSRCLEALHRAEVPALLMKGAQLAYSHYERPDLRPRIDADVIIPLDARARVSEALSGIGYEPEEQLPGELVMYQIAYTKRRNAVMVHTLDVHWRIANPQVFSAVLPYEELASTAVPVPALGPAARGLSQANALLLACVHRVAHHFGTDYLLWLYDIHLIASRLDSSEWAQVVALAEQRSVTAVCAQGIGRAAHYFQTSVPEDVAARLNEVRRSPAETATAAYLAPRRRHVENVIADIRALPGWNNRLRLVLEHVFPPPRYMREVYAPTSTAPLALLYVQRVARGARRWFGRPS